MGDLKNRLIIVAFAIFITTYTVLMLSFFGGDIMHKTFLMCCAIMCVSTFLLLSIYRMVDKKDTTKRRSKSKSNKRKRK
jgi:Na+/melibiose symporter-like transporter